MDLTSIGIVLSSTGIVSSVATGILASKWRIIDTYRIVSGKRQEDELLLREQHILEGAALRGTSGYITQTSSIGGESSALSTGLIYSSALDTESINYNDEQDATGILEQSQIDILEKKRKQYQGEKVFNQTGVLASDSQSKVQQRVEQVEIPNNYQTTYQQPNEQQYVQQLRHNSYQQQQQQQVIPPVRKPREVKIENKVNILEFNGPINNITVEPVKKQHSKYVIPPLKVVRQTTQSKYALPSTQQINNNSERMTNRGTQAPKPEVTKLKSKPAQQQTQRPQIHKQIKPLEATNSTRTYREVDTQGRIRTLQQKPSQPSFNINNINAQEQLTDVLENVYKVTEISLTGESLTQQTGEVHETPFKQDTQVLQAPPEQTYDATQALVQTEELKIEVKQPQPVTNVEITTQLTDSNIDILRITKGGAFEYA